MTDPVHVKGEEDPCLGNGIGIAPDLYIAIFDAITEVEASRMGRQALEEMTRSSNDKAHHPS